MWQEANKVMGAKGRQYPWIYKHNLASVLIRRRVESWTHEHGTKDFIFNSVDSRIPYQNYYYQNQDVLILFFDDINLDWLGDKRPGPKDIS